MFEKLKSATSTRLFILLILLAVLPLAIFALGKQQEIRQRASEIIQVNQIQGLTSQLIQTRDKYNQSYSNTTQESETKASLDVMKTVAIARRNALIKELEVNPQEFLNHAILGNQKQTFPQEIQQYIEEPINIEGTLRLLHFDNPSEKKSKEDFILEELQDARNVSKRYILKFTNKPDNSAINKKVRIRGIKLDQYIATDEDVSVADARSVNNNSNAANIFPPNQANVAVILIKFQDTTTSPFTPESVESTMFTANNSIKKFYEETSFNKLSLSGNVFGWYTIPYSSSSSCDLYFGWAQAARQAAINDGVQLTNYNYLMYTFPRNLSCFAPGWALIAGSESWINGSATPYIMGHELGHNLGVHHASTLSCGAKAIDTYANCSQSEYGNTYDIMGFGYKQFNAPHKVAVGWMPESKVQTITTNGSYTITPTEISSTTLPQALRIRKNNTNEYYYVQYRQPLGFDSGLINSPHVIKGATIEVWNGNQFNKTKLLFLGPPTASFYYEEALPDGGVFIDPLNNIEIRQLSHDSNSVTVAINFSQISTTPSITPTSTPTPPTSPTPTPIPSVRFSLSETIATAPVGQSFSIGLFLVNADHDISGVDFTLQYDSSILELASFSAEPSVFSTKLINRIDNANGKLRYVAVETGTISRQPNYTLGTLMFVGKSPGTTAVTFTNTQITALNIPVQIPNQNNESGSYIITQAIATPTPTNPPRPGDANGDGIVDIIDYNIWRDEFIAVNTPLGGGFRADFNQDGTVDLVDFNIWRNAFNAQ